MAASSGVNPWDWATGQSRIDTLAKNLIEKRGRLNNQDADRFIAAGFSKELLLEVIAVVAASTITNYTGSVTLPPVEAPFKAHVWSAD